MKKKEIDYSKILVLESKIQELKNKVLLNYINSINDNEKKASKNIESLSNKVKNDKRILKRENKDLKDLKILYGMSIFAGALLTFAFSLSMPFIFTVLEALCILYLLKEAKKEYINPINESINKRKKRIKDNEDLLESNKLIVRESKNRISEVTANCNSKIFEKLEKELLKTSNDLEEVYNQYVQILSNFENEVSNEKKNIESVVKSPLMVDTIDVLYETRYEKAKNKSLQLKK